MSLNVARSKSAIEDAGDGLHVGMQFPKGVSTTAIFLGPTAKDHKQWNYCISNVDGDNVMVEESLL